MEIYYLINNPFIISSKFIGLIWISWPFFDNSYIELIAHFPLPYSLLLMALFTQLFKLFQFCLCLLYKEDKSKG